MNVLVIHGPNLNLLGKREPDISGTVTLEEINNRLVLLARELGTDVTFFQSNHEGDLVQKIQDAHGYLPGACDIPGHILIRASLCAMLSRRREYPRSKCTFRTSW